jgi:hypothetical protein
MRQDAVDQLMVMEVCTHLLPVENKSCASASSGVTGRPARQRSGIERKPHVAVSLAA